MDLVHYGFISVPLPPAAMMTFFVWKNYTKHATDEVKGGDGRDGGWHSEVEQTTRESSTPAPGP